VRALLAAVLVVAMDETKAPTVKDREITLR
jgi:hypothetical protein